MSTLQDPQPGDKVLLVVREGEMAGLIPLLLGEKVHPTIVPTVVEAVSKLSEPFDLIWLCLPRPGFHTRLFLDLILAQPDLAYCVGIEKGFPTLQELTQLVKSRVPRRQDEKWVRIRMQTENEREWVKHLLEQCQRRKSGGRE